MSRLLPRDPTLFSSLSSGAVITLIVLGSITIVVLIGLLVIVVAQQRKLRNLCKDPEGLEPDLPIDCNEKTVLTIRPRAKLVRKTRRAPGNRLDWDPPLMPQPTIPESLSEKSLVQLHEPRLKMHDHATDFTLLNRSQFPNHNDILSGGQQWELASSPSPPRLSTQCNLTPEHPARAYNSNGNLCPPPLFSLARQDLVQNRVRPRPRAHTVSSSVGSSEPGLHISHKQRTNHGRSLSFSSQKSGRIPTEPVPPLPLSLRNAIKARGASKDHVNGTSPRVSSSSFETIGSSVLQLSPMNVRSSSVKIKKGADRQWKNSVILGPRYIRKAKSMHAHGMSWSGQKSVKSLRSIHSVEGQYSVLSSTPGPGHKASLSTTTVEDTSNQCHSATLRRLSPTRARDYPRKSSFSHESLFINDICPPCQASQLQSSPQVIEPTLTLACPSYNAHQSPSHNQESNMFNWSTLKTQVNRPSAMKGSPNARKGHRRQNCVRISSPDSLSARYNISTASMQRVSRDFDLPQSTPSIRIDDEPLELRSLPRPPSISVFAPSIILPKASSSFCDKSQELSSKAFGNESLDQVPSLPSSYCSRKHHSLSNAPFAFEQVFERHDEAHTAPVEFRLMARPIQCGNDDSQTTIRTEQVGTIPDSLEISSNVLDSKMERMGDHDPFQTSLDSSKIDSEEQPSLRLSVIELRRMNSEAKYDNRAAQRYLRFSTRNESPSPISRGLNIPSSSIVRSISGASAQTTLSALLRDDSMSCFASEVDLVLREHDECSAQPDQVRLAYGVNPLDTINPPTIESPIPMEPDEADILIWNDDLANSTVRKRAAGTAPSRGLASVTGNIQKIFTPSSMKYMMPEATPKSIYDENGFWKDENIELEDQAKGSND